VSVLLKIAAAMRRKPGHRDLRVCDITPENGGRIDCTKVSVNTVIYGDASTRIALAEV